VSTIRASLYVAVGVLLGALASAIVTHGHVQSAASALAQDHYVEMALQLKQTIAALRSLRSGNVEDGVGQLALQLRAQVQEMANYSASRRRHGQPPEISSALVALTHYRADYPSLLPNTSLERTRDR
jgi:hypothetical protein